MTKAQLIAKIAKKTGITKKSVGTVCDAIFDSMTETLAAGEAMQISGFGVFAPKDRPARICKNPKTGEFIEVAESRSAVFTPSKTLKERINETR